MPSLLQKAELSALSNDSEFGSPGNLAIDAVKDALQRPDAKGQLAEDRSEGQSDLSEFRDGAMVGPYSSSGKEGT